MIIWKQMEHLELDSPAVFLIGCSEEMQHNSLPKRASDSETKIATQMLMQCALSNKRWQHWLTDHQGFNKLKIYFKRWVFKEITEGLNAFFDLSSIGRIYFGFRQRHRQGPDQEKIIENSERNEKVTLCRKKGDLGVCTPSEPGPSKCYDGYK